VHLEHREIFHAISQKHAQASVLQYLALAHAHAPPSRLGMSLGYELPHEPHHEPLDAPASMSPHFGVMGVASTTVDVARER
jgi:hypothetical protein